jgi:phosphotransferase system HPr (HPr) family protein
VPPSSDATTRRATLPADVALHARPAGVFVRAAARFGSPIVVSANGKSANAKSILQVLGLGALGGTELAIAASGSDATEAADHLACLVPQLAE